MVSLEKTDEIIEKRIRQALCLLLWLGAAAFFYIAVILAVFGGTVWDKGIYGLASVLFAVFMSLWLYHIPILERVRSWREEAVLVDRLQNCCFACICLMTLYYYNSGSEYGHSVATRVMNSAFGIALFYMYRKEERSRKWIGILQSVSGVVFIAGIYLQERDEKELVLYLLSGITVWIYCGVLGCLAGRIGRKEICTRFSPFGWLVFALFAGMVLFRNTRTWPFSVVIPFGSLYLYRFTPAGMNRLLKNFCYGCILAFWLMFGSAVLFRPYYSFEFVRYPGWFNSVATAGLFWTLVFVCTISCILAKYRGIRRIPQCLFELMTLGAVSAYLLMTLSRTAMLSVVAVSLTVFLLAEVCFYRDSLKEMGVKILMVISPALLVFPVVYTMTRCGPALVGRPVWITGAEWFSDRIEKQEDMDSTKYMNLPQFGETFLEKWFGIEINLTQLAGSVSGPGEKTREDGEMSTDNVVGTQEVDGQLYTIKDYTFHNPDEGDISNGRFEIFDLYYKNLNLTGHDSMLVEDVDEQITLYHAHNSYLQVAHDHGIVTGILFLLTVAGGLVQGALYYKRNCKTVDFAIFPITVVLAFMIAGMTEWIFHPSIPIGFAFLIGLTPLAGKKESV